MSGLFHVMEKPKSAGNALEELSQIDVSAIAELVRIKGEEQVLNDRLSRMEAFREKVSAVVYARVRSDYQSRLAGLAVQSRPLKDRARQEYAKLWALSVEVNRVADEAKLEKEELEFRRELGEFQPDEFKKRLARCEKYLDGRQQELAEIEQLRKQFLQAVHDEAEIEGPTPAPASGPAASTAASGPPPAEERPIETVPPPAPSLSEADVTMIAPTPKSKGDVTLEAGVPISPGAPTARLAASRIIVFDEDRPAGEHMLQRGTTSIGRSPKSGIVLPAGEIARHHADIVFVENGYRILDSGSGSGILVNGKRVKERLLHDGDLIQIGMQKLLFKE